MLLYTDVAAVWNWQKFGMPRVVNMDLLAVNYCHSNATSQISLREGLVPFWRIREAL
jgi:hypothetical protein